MDGHSVIRCFRMGHFVSLPFRLFLGQMNSSDVFVQKYNNNSEHFFLKIE